MFAIYCILESILFRAWELVYPLPYLLIVFAKWRQETYIVTMRMESSVENYIKGGSLDYRLRMG